MINIDKVQNDIDINERIIKLSSKTYKVFIFIAVLCFSMIALNIPAIHRLEPWAMFSAGLNGMALLYLLGDIFALISEIKYLRKMNFIDYEFIRKIEEINNKFNFNLEEHA